MIEDIVGNNGTRFIIAAGAVALGLLCLVAVLRFIRNRPSSPFLRGGKNREPRLAVLDAAAIDTRRRLVLVRRDDVEHLIMIGGPTDVVIESRIGSQVQTIPQTGATAPLPQTAIARPIDERRAAAPQPETNRPETNRPETRSAPVSAMGQVLYGEGSNASTPVRAVQPTQTRAQPEIAPTLRPAIPERKIPVQNPPRPQPVASNTTPPVAIQTARSPEDILDAARSRVLVANQPLANQPVPAQRPPTQQNPVTPAMVATPVIPMIEDRKDTSALEFERILDAEITGDLGKLTAADGRVENDQRQNPVSPDPANRHQPRVGTLQGERTEPTLEDEMNRMLSEIAVNRKN